MPDYDNLAFFGILYMTWILFWVGVTRVLKVERRHSVRINGIVDLCLDPRLL